MGSMLSPLGGTLQAMCNPWLLARARRIAIVV